MTEEASERPVPRRAENIDPPAVIVLGDAATLTRGSDQSGSESKRTPYD
ncbi:albusnodin family lasso peptide [Streptomyces sp. MS1.AVA.3]